MAQNEFSVCKAAKTDLLWTNSSHKEELIDGYFTLI